MENESLEVKTTEIKATKQKLTPGFSLLKSSVLIWWKNFIKFVEMYVWAIYYSLIPLAVVALSIVAMLIYGQTLNAWLQTVFFVLMLMCAVAIIYFEIRAYVGMFLLIKKDYQGKGRETFRETASLAGSYFALSLLTAVLILLWSLLLIIPGIIYSVFYSLAVYVFFFEDKRGMAAIRRSKELIKGYWWAVLGRTSFFVLVLWIFSFILSIPLILTQETSIFYQLWDTLVQILSALMSPIALLFSYQIYKDLVNIKK